MSYPFANNPYAQSAANRNDRYHDPYDNSADHTYNQYAPYSEDHDQDHPSQAYTDQRRRYDDEELEDEGYHDDMHRGASGRGPPPAGYADGGPTEKYGSTPGYAPAGPVALRGKSIWQREDKNAFAQRSLPAKCFRTIFCILIIGIIFVISIICLILMFVRPPNVAIGGFTVPNSTNAVQYQNNAFSFNVSVDIAVSNPNSISATLTSLKATAYDTAEKSTSVGGGSLDNVKIEPHANTTFQFPFQIKYDASKDPNSTILKDIASKCGISLQGVTSGSVGSGDLDFTFNIDIHISVLSVSIPVSFSKDAQFPCPLSGADIAKAIGDLGSILGGGTASRRALDLEAATALPVARGISPTPLLRVRELDEHEKRAADEVL